MEAKKEHWEKVYNTKKINEVSWYQPVPETSIELLHQFNLNKSSKIIDVGGGDSLLVDFLLKEGFEDITVLDISESALQKAKTRLGDLSKKVKWIASDITSFIPEREYDLWHDRAVFHFLTSEDDINKYIGVLQNGLMSNGGLVLGTFSEEGPKKCSGLEIKQYTEVSMTDRLKKLFDKIKCITVDHLTPFNTIQNFIFCTFRKKTDIV